ncbi:Intracellular sulfur oxidation protein, DsrE/DsrF family [Modestobacter sp. DSM 44400]|uniref:hypothetical protein n=1 Tax=Modestobacter sp. DSM 44400 TaxID=1550230 RepID=UPI000899CEB4|nr:hypothetical protein [Modestobacter sp. DSM 44400]SDY80066.1 Intracellular sulfur oxidation protein, DsrE/DsrF family [Modestobacter sp. DSM 44400]
MNLLVDLSAANAAQVEVIAHGGELHLPLPGVGTADAVRELQDRGGSSQPCANTLHSRQLAVTTCSPEMQSVIAGVGEIVRR